MRRFSKACMQILLITTTCVLLMNMTPLPAASAAEDIWTEDSPQAPEHASGPERIDRLLERIAEDDPKRAKELKQLSKKDPEEFQKQIHQEMQALFEKHGRSRQRPGRQGDEHRGPRQPSMTGPDGMGKGHGGMGMGPGMMGPGGMGGSSGPGMGRGKSRGGYSGDRGSERGDREHGRRWKERVQGQHDDFIEWFEKNYPVKAKKLLELRDKDPEKYMKSFM